MNSLSSNLLRVASLALALPAFGLCAAVQINGVCIQGNCITPSTVSFGGSESGSTSNNVVLNTDPFMVTSTFSVSYDAAGSHIVFDPVATYVGKMNSVGTESITIDLLASIFDDSPGSFDGKYFEHIGLNITQNSTGSGELFVDGQGIGIVGPKGPGVYAVTTKSAMLTGLDGDTLNYDFKLIFDFTPGVAPGGFDSTEVPEPVQTIPAALGLVGLALAASRRRKA